MFPTLNAYRRGTKYLSCSAMWSHKYGREEYICHKDSHGHNSTLPRAGYMTSGEVDMLLEKGAVGDMFSRVIDIEGNICDKTIDGRTIGIELHHLLEKEYRIGVAGGVRKAKSIYAMLKGGYPNVLIIDEETCLEVLKLHQDMI